MKQVVLNGKKREAAVRKSESKNLRKNQEIPCVIYGNGLENILFTVGLKEFNIINNTPNSYIIELKIDGKSYLSILHQIQYDPVTDLPIHIDFLSVSEKKPVVINVPIEITGHSEGVKQGGKLLVQSRKLKVSGLIKDLPDVLKVDISNLLIGKQINAGDLNYDNIKIVSPKTAMVCSVRTTRVVEEVPEEGAATPEAGAEGAEGADAAPAAESK